MREGQGYKNCDLGVPTEQRLVGTTPMTLSSPMRATTHGARNTLWAAVAYDLLQSHESNNTWSTEYLVSGRYESYNTCTWSMEYLVSGSYESYNTCIWSTEYLVSGSWLHERVRVTHCVISKFLLETSSIPQRPQRSAYNGASCASLQGDLLITWYQSRQVSIFFLLIDKTSLFQTQR